LIDNNPNNKKLLKNIINNVEKLVRKIKKGWLMELYFVWYNIWNISIVGGKNVKKCNRDKKCYKIF
jgi:hypothetical protein